jgi:hypothetical protein
VAVNSIVLSDPELESSAGESSQNSITPTNFSSSGHGDDESFSDDSPWSEESGYESAAADRYDEHPGAKAIGRQAQKDQLELPTLLRLISFLVVCLYRMPIRQFAATKQIKTKISERASFYQHFDFLFVQDLFPQMDAIAAANLGRSISQRRSVLFYKDARDKQLEALDSGDSDSEPPAPAPNERIAVDETLIHKILRRELAFSEGKSVPFTLPSKATTFIQKPSQQSWLYPPPPSVAISQKSITSNYAAQELAIAVPKMPVASGSTTDDAFVCPYCCSPQRVMSEELWKKHVFNDLKPYICTFPSCELEDQIFADRSQWWQHETEVHRFEWHCNTRHHQTYDDQERFLRHMQEEHSTSFTSKQLCELTSIFRSPLTKAAGVCNLCFRHSENLKSHVSRHLQRIALFALPRFTDVSDTASKYVRGEGSLEGALDMGLQEDTNMAADIAVTPERRSYENDKTENLSSLGTGPNSRLSAHLHPKFSFTAEQIQLWSNEDVVQSWLRSSGFGDSLIAGMR